jgi:hypothetical protein
MIPKIHKGDKKLEVYNKLKRNAALKCIKHISDDQKEFTLVVITNKREEHLKIAEKLLRNKGYNIAIIMNSEQNKNYKVLYKSDIETMTNIKEWHLPYTKIEILAERGDLSLYKKVPTNIDNKFDITMSYMLQAAIFMDTDIDYNRIQHNVCAKEYVKLCALNNAITSSSSVGKTNARPSDWPQKPKVALIAGAIAGRGNTFQNQMIDLVFTSFIFAGESDTKQCGALNAQRFGRACGLLGDIFIHKNRRPTVVITEEVLRDALANEIALYEKAKEIKDGTMIALKDLISREEWETVMSRSRKQVKEASHTNKPKSTIIIGNDIIYSKAGTSQITVADRLLMEYYKFSAKGTQSFTYDDINKCPQAKVIHTVDHHRSHKLLFNEGYIETIKNGTNSKKTFIMTQKAIHYLDIILSNRQDIP